MDLADLDFDLPPELIAQEPLPARDASRLMVVERPDRLTHTRFDALPGWLRPGDVLVINDARVLPARALGLREATGGRAELLFLHPLLPTPETWEVMLGTRGKPVAGEVFALCDGQLRVRLLEGGGRVRRVESLADEPVTTLLERHGRLPLPPYIARSAPDPRDRERYQTVYADKPVAAAAPTAGLHFTPALLAQLEAQGVELRRLTLEVGPGTFLPIKTRAVEEHTMHVERYRIPEPTAAAVAAAKAEGRRVIAVGTTSLRALEAAAAGGSGEGATDLYIRPGYRFRAIDALITNFHFPKSTLLLLVMAFLGEELMWKAYRAAIAERYRFFSYGDAMLLL